MLAFIEGIIEQATPLVTILNVNGLGYRVETPVTTSEKLPPVGNSVRLYVHPVYREDHQSLYGFFAPEEREFFKLITERVSGIGPKIALSLMSKLSMPMLQDAISRGDAALIAKTPGIGKKTAERLCVELSDKMPKSHPGSGSTGSSSDLTPQVYAGDSIQDAVQALLTLGFKLDAADKAIRSAARNLGSDATTEKLVKTALRSG